MRSRLSCTGWAAPNRRPSRASMPPRTVPRCYQGRSAHHGMLGCVGRHRPSAQPGVTAPCRRALDAISRDQLPEPASARPRRALVVAQSRTPSRFGCGRALIMKVCAVAPSIRRNRPGGPPAAIRHSPPQAHGFAPDFVRSARGNARGTSVRRVPGAASARQRSPARRPAYPRSAMTSRLAARYSSVSSKLSLATRFTGTMPATWLGSPAAGAPAST